MKHRILVVDDDLQFLKFLGHWLEIEGHEVILADGLEGGFLKIAEEPLPDIVLLGVCPSIPKLHVTNTTRCSHRQLGHNI